MTATLRDSASSMLGARRNGKLMLREDEGDREQPGQLTYWIGFKPHTMIKSVSKVFSFTLLTYRPGTRLNSNNNNNIQKISPMAPAHGGTQIFYSESG